ncbi:MAG: thiol reductant ABC exporter subunit CydD [Chloroflexi bacterium]|nr:thiol reductant ABC exporter subunit CydD [Chloroflexota bacterium]
MNLDRRLLRQLETVRVLFGGAILLSATSGLLLIAQAWLLSQIVARVFLREQGLGDVAPLLAALLAVIVLRAVVTWGGDAVASETAERIKGDLRERLYARIIALGPAYTRGERSGELANTAIAGIEALDAYISQYLPQLVLALLIPLGMLAVVFPLDPLSGIVLLVTAPLIPFFMILIGGMASRLTRSQFTQLSRMSAHFLDVLQGLAVLRQFGRSRDQIATIRRISERFRDTTMGVLRVAFLSALVLEMLATISTAIIAVEIGLRLLYGRMVFEDAFFVLILAPEFYLPLRMLGTRFHAGMSGVAAAARIFDVLETPLPDCGPPAPRRAIPQPPFTLRFQDVQYAYDSGERPALNGITFAIEAGQRVALVGPSGAGKSTVAQLLLRFLAPTAGQITVNGIGLCAIAPDEWRRHVAWVPQTPYLFADTIAGNIRLGRPDAPLADVIRAAERAHLDRFIATLPGGYDTPIGERGARLSGGQAQRVALARAFLKDAPVLILDEATANLDPATESLIQDAMGALMQGRTTLIIAHRLQTVQNADQILVLEAGRLVQAGVHVDLAAGPGLYRDLVQTHGAQVMP